MPAGDTPRQVPPPTPQISGIRCNALAQARVPRLGLFICRGASHAQRRTPSIHGAVCKNRRHALPLSGHRMRILVIEDNTDIAANLGDYLEDRGHTVDFAADGVTGLQLADGKSTRLHYS